MAVSRHPIGPKDTVSVCGRYLCKDYSGIRFFVRGIAFPVAPDDSYDEQGWIAILRQMQALHLDYNTVRMYRMDPTVDYSGFFKVAAEMGIYVIVPLTSVKGDGVLSREEAAPKCYTRELYRFGVTSLENFLRYPNILAGLLGNEVMNSPDSWAAAPCLKAYARDLKTYMRRVERRSERTLPLIYAAQESSITPSADVVTSMRHTVDYLTCSRAPAIDRPVANTLERNFSPNPAESIDIFGVNVESWCSSTTSFTLNDDGSEGSYKRLHDGVHTSTLPLVFSEMGCSHLQFDRDKDNSGDVNNEVGRNRKEQQEQRDWTQISTVLGPEMIDDWSGFCAYAYYGNEQFNMFDGGPWNGVDVLLPTGDFDNFRYQMTLGSNWVTHRSWNTTRAEESSPLLHPYCPHVESTFSSSFGIDLYDYSLIPSYAEERDFMFLLAVGTALLVSVRLIEFIKFMKKATSSRRRYHTLQ